MAERRPGDPTAPRSRRPSLATLGRDADGGDEDAMLDLTDRAAKRGLDPDDYDTWAELAAALAPARRTKTPDADVVATPAARTPRPRARAIEPEPAPAPGGFCENCGAPLAAGEDPCRRCGTRRGERGVAVPLGPTRTNGLAIWSLILGIFPVAYIGAFLAVIFGFRARKQIRESGGTQSGSGLALAGIILGFVMIVFVPLVSVPIILGASHEVNKLSSTNDFVNGSGSGTSFTPPDGTFHATFPSTPVHTSQTLNLGVRQGTLNIYTTDTPDRSFAVEDLAYAPGTPFSVTAAAQGAAGGAGGTLQSSQQTTVQGFPADEFVIAGKQGIYIKGFVVKTPAHGFIILVGGKENPPLGYDKFKRSFQITTSG